MIEAFTFPIIDTIIVPAISGRSESGVVVSNVTPSPRPAKLVVVTLLPGGYDNGLTKTANATVTVWAGNLTDWKRIAYRTRDILTSTSTDAIVNITCSEPMIVANDTTQVQGYFTVTVGLRANGLVA